MNWNLMNSADYSDSKTIKKLLLNYSGLVRLAEKGDQVAMCVIVDLRMAISSRGVLTKKQRKYLGLWLEGYRQEDVATMHRVSQQAVGYVIDYGLSNIAKYLR